jgi:phosphonoacetaldehyde hydrolase
MTTSNHTYRGPLKLAVFDFAGTTVDYGCCAPAAVFIEGYRRQGVEITMAQARGPMGMEKRAHIQTIGAMPEVAAKWQQVHGRAMTAQDIDAMYDDFVPLLLAVLAEYSDLIPGTVATMDHLRAHDILIAGTTGYFDEALEIVQAAAAKQGYTPDFATCATRVPAGRPAPWMIYRAMEALNVYPPAAVVKVGDTVPDIAAGLNAGVWTVGVAKTGNEVGLSEAELAALDPAAATPLIAAARQKLANAGAHYVIDGIDELPTIVAQINDRLAQGEQP